jgi:hypothetical protein
MGGAPMVPPGIRLRHSPRWIAALALVAVGLLVPAFGAIGSGTTAQRVERSSSIVHAPPPTASHCHTPAAIKIGQPGPNMAAAKGVRLAATFEMEIAPYRAADGTITVYLPRVGAVFPLSNGHDLNLSLAPHNVTRVAGSWTSAASDTMATTLSGPETFTNGTALLTSNLVGAMASVTGFEQLNLSFRWQWSVTTTSGTTTGPWGSSNYGGCPTADFWPAPFVKLVRDWNLTSAPGGTFTAALLGHISQQYFFLELETPTGHVVYAHGQTAPKGNTTPFDVTIRYDCWCGHALAAGPYLVHIHNSMGSILYVIRVTIT